jgi:rare lipoprotein A
MSKYYTTLLLFFLLCHYVHVPAQDNKEETEDVPDRPWKKNDNHKVDANVDTKKIKSPRILYGTASYYANKFQGRTTANGEIFDQEKMTAACNVLPFGTWIRVTNLRNSRSVIVRINDRLHPRMTRLVDMSRIGAQKLNYLSSGLARIKVEVLGKQNPQAD